MPQMHRATYGANEDVLLLVGKIIDVSVGRAMRTDLGERIYGPKSKKP